jgi:L-ascorbate metabolism protein UlaG (beta-lactamase superfamily)
VPFDWRQYLTYRGIKFSCFPARHACCRFGVDFCERLWCSWLIERDNISVYFPGDTAIGPHFREVREAVGRPIDLAMMPIGPKEPTDMMRVVHLNPEDALDMSGVLEAQSVFPIHYGSFGFGAKPEGEDEITELRRRFREARNETLHVIETGRRVEWTGERFVPITE